MNLSAVAETPEPATVAPGVVATHLGQHQVALAKVFTEAAAFDLRAYEGPTSMVDELEARTRALLDRAVATLRAILDACEANQAGADTTDEFGFEDAVAEVMSAPSSVSAVEELAFMASLELRQCDARIVSTRASGTAMNRLITCDTSLRRLRRGVAAVENQIAALTDVAARIDLAPHLEISLRVRRAYGKFCRAVSGEGEPTAESLRARLRSLGTQIAVLVGWDVYPEFRVQDRLLLHDLQHRVLDWLRAGDDAVPATGVRIWQDLSSTVQMFRQISRRAELVNHDAALLARLVPMYGATAPGAPMTDACVHELRPLAGLDLELDEILLGGERTSMGELTAILRRLHAGSASA